MDVVLVNGIHFSTNNIMPQLGSICLYQELKNLYDVHIINFDYLFYKGCIKYSNNMRENIDIFAKYILELKPKIVQMYTICMSYPLMLLIAQKIKELNNKVIIIMGGPQVTSTVIESLNKFNFIDVIGLGEGESYICELVDALINNKSLKSIKGIAFRIEGKCFINRCDEVVNVNELGSYTKFDFQEYIDVFKNVNERIEDYEFQIESGRGCPFNCTFCSSSVFWQRKFRVKPAEKIIDEIKLFHNKYGFMKFSLDHDMFTANKEYLITFCDLIIRNNFNITWGCSSRLDVLDDDMLAKMKKSNCKSIYVGFETGSESMQKNINKNLEVQEAIKIIKKIKDLGISITVSFIYGFPEEKESDFFDTIHVIEELYSVGCENIQLHKYFPLPYTDEKKKIDKLYFDEEDIDLSIYNKGVYKGILSNLIKKDKEIFSAFYSFKSIVRFKYKRFDLLIVCLNIMNIYFKTSIKYLIYKKGLLYIYSQYESYIVHAYKKINNRNVNQFLLNYMEKEILLDLLIKIFEEVILYEDDVFLREMFRFENILYQYRIHKINEEKIYCFYINVIDIEKNINKYEEKLCFVKFKKGLSDIIVKKMNVNYK